jgi:hypothetical protein
MILWRDYFGLTTFLISKRDTEWNRNCVLDYISETLSDNEGDVHEVYSKPVLIKPLIMYTTGKEGGDF